jgi:SAM-dependent methyltransferase
MVDDLNLLNVLTEDNLFGAKLWEFIPGKLISRDLIDSILEITFLQKQVGFGFNDQFRVLDIGAGYGRFAHRFTAAFPQNVVTSIDAVATSTFLSDFYLKFRRCNHTDVVPFDRISDLQCGTYNLATNIHSWSECTKQFIAFWLNWLCDLNIPYLFIVPHSETLSTVERDGSHLIYDDELENRGFKLIVKQRKFNRSKYVDQVGVFPAEYRLYKREKN